MRLTKSTPVGVLTNQTTGESWVWGGSGPAQPLTPNTLPLQETVAPGMSLRPEVFYPPSFLPPPADFLIEQNPYLDALVPLPQELEVNPRVLYLPADYYTQVFRDVRRLYGRVQVVLRDPIAIKRAMLTSNLNPLLIKGIRLVDQAVMHDIESQPRTRPLIFFVDPHPALIYPRGRSLYDPGSTGLPKVPPNLWGVLTSWAFKMYEGVAFEDRQAGEYWDMLPEWGDLPWL